MKIIEKKVIYEVDDAVLVEVKGIKQVTSIKKTENRCVIWYFVDLPILKMFNVRIDNSNILGLVLSDN